MYNYKENTPLELKQNQICLLVQCCNENVTINVYWQSVLWNRVLFSVSQSWHNVFIITVIIQIFFFQNRLLGCKRDYLYALGNFL